MCCSSLSSLQEPCNELIVSNLQGFSFNAGTQPGQQQPSLYDTLSELCKEKNVILSQHHFSVDDADFVYTKTMINADYLLKGR